MSEGISASDIALLNNVLDKIGENFADRMQPAETKSVKNMRENVAKLRTDTEVGKVQNRAAYDDSLKRATALLKELSTRKPVKIEKEPETVVWEVTSFEDKGHCADAASNSPGIVKTTYANAKRKFMEERTITEGDLGVLYESNLTTQGNKYSLFFKYVRISEGKAKMVALAIASHDGSSSTKYYKIDKNGKRTEEQISATKKL